MNQVQVFNHSMFGELRTVDINGKLFAVGNDVAKALEYVRPREAVSAHCKGAVTYRYRLIVKASDQTRSPEIKAKAEQCEKWIFDEVLPSIRQTGGYVANDDLFISTYLPHADEQTKLMFRAMLDHVKRTNEKIALMKPKAEYFDALVETNLLTNFRETAKELQVKEKAFINWLLERKYIYRDAKGKPQPYSQYAQKLFETKEWEKNGKSGMQTLITPKGRETFRLLLKIKAG